MEPNPEIDVAVVGAGPAGSLTAYRLAKAGARVVMIEANRFPREKPCGGGIQQRAVSLIPFPWNSKVQGDFQEVSFSYNLARRFIRRSKQTLVSCVLRSEFDQFLLARAEAAGAVVWQECRVLGVSDEGRTNVTLQTSRGEVRARFVIGADGANGVVSAHLNSRDSYYWQVALYCEIPLEHVMPDVLRSNTMRIDWGSLPSGYGWIFPKKETANIGVGCPASIGKFLRPYLARFLDTEAVLRSGAHSRLKFRGHQLPTLTRRTRLSSARVLLVGDAAGLVEPLTGEGISNACHSAEIAARHILAALEEGRPGVSYDHRIRSEIGLELGWARQLLSLAVTFPQLLFRVFKENDIVWDKFCRVLRGEESFYALKLAIMGRFDCLWTPVRHFAEWRERYRLGSFCPKLKESIGGEATP